MITMKKTFVLFLLFFIEIKANEIKNAATLELFSCKYITFDMSSDSILNFEGKMKKLEVVAIIPLKKMGDLSLTNSDFKNLYKEALVYDSSGDPFQVGGHNFLIKMNENEWFEVFYEYHEKNPKFLNNKRLAINRLNKIDENNNILVSNKETDEEGYSFSKLLISEISRIFKEQTKKSKQRAKGSAKEKGVSP